MNRQQRIVVWVVASVLSAVSIANGYMGLFQWWNNEVLTFYWRRDSILWFVVLPVFLLGLAAFLHFARRKD